MSVGLAVSKIKHSPIAEQHNVPRLLTLPVSGLQVNLFSMVVLTKDGKTKVIKKSPTNNPKYRVRPPGSLKAIGAGMTVQAATKTDQKNDTFAK